VDDFFVLLRAIVWFVVLISNALIFGGFFIGPFSLLIDEILVHFVVFLSMCLSFSVLKLAEGKVTVKLSFFIFTPLFQEEKIFLVAV
jgi:hypothetical protein